MFEFLNDIVRLVVEIVMICRVKCINLFFVQSSIGVKILFGNLIVYKEFEEYNF